MEAVKLLFSFAIFLSIYFRLKNKRPEAEEETKKEKETDKETGISKKDGGKKETDQETWRKKTVKGKRKRNRPRSEE